MEGNRFTQFQYQGNVTLPTLTKRKRFFEHQNKQIIRIPLKVVERKKRRKSTRADISKSQKKEVFFLFYPDARNTTGASKGYKCVICQENLMYMDVTNSWNASHIRPIKYCPLRDPKYVIPTCTSCNGRMGLLEKDQINAFDMMVRYNFRKRIYPIAKVLHHRYAAEGTSVLSFVHEIYGKATKNQEGVLDPRLIINDPAVYQEIADREAEERRDEGQEEVDRKTSQIHDLHEEIRQLLVQVEQVRTQEKGAMMRMFQNVLDYDNEKNKIFKACGVFL